MVHCVPVLYPVCSKRSHSCAISGKDFQIDLENCEECNTAVCSSHTHWCRLTGLCAQNDFTISLYFPGGSDGKAPAYSAGDLGLIPRSGTSSGEGNGYPLQYSCLENPMDGGA